jgi:glycine/sarcosine N-methyltransferase
MTVFDELALIYDQSIDWDTRLQRELPFLTALVKDKKSAHILDLACGSGRHAVALAKERNEVIGLDLSPQMIAAATRYAEKHEVNVQFQTTDIQDVKTTVTGPFDLILCLGNSLALLPSINALKITLSGIRSLLTEDGYFVSQILNFEEIRSSKFRFFPLKSGTIAAGNEVIFARFFEPFPDTETATLVFTGFIKTETGWKTKTHTQQVLQLTHPLLKQLLSTTGFTRTQYYADYRRNEFSPTKSRNLLILAQK